MLLSPAKRKQLGEQRIDISIAHAARHDEENPAFFGQPQPPARLGLILADGKPPGNRNARNDELLFRNALLDELGFQILMRDEKVVRLSLLPEGNAGVIRRDGIGFGGQPVIFADGRNRLGGEQVRHENRIKAVFLDIGGKPPRRRFVGVVDDGFEFIRADEFARPIGQAKERGRLGCDIDVCIADDFGFFLSGEQQNIAHARLDIAFAQRLQNGLAGGIVPAACIGR